MIEAQSASKAGSVNLGSAGTLLYDFLICAGCGSTKVRVFLTKFYVPGSVTFVLSSRESVIIVISSHESVTFVLGSGESVTIVLHSRESVIIVLRSRESVTAILKFT